MAVSETMGGLQCGNMSSETHTRQHVETSGKMDNGSGNQQGLLQDILQKVNLIPEVLDDIRSIKED